MTDVSLIAEKIKEVSEEMKRVGLWTTTTPTWVMQYEKRSIITDEDFCEWLQFIYLPNRRQENESNQLVVERNYIVPQAIKFFKPDIKKGKLLQLLIELDSLL